MKARCVLRLALYAGVAVLILAADPNGPNVRAASTSQVVPLSADVLYDGWRGSRLIGRGVFSKTQKKLGTVRNIVLDTAGGIQAFVVEANQEKSNPGFAYRIPWQVVDKAKLPEAIVADVADLKQPTYGLFSEKGQAAEVSDEFRFTEITDEYARLQPGLAFGYVSDVVFTKGGTMLAILVTRDAVAGGGTYAFGFPGKIGDWSPKMSYYGLPYITPDQATKAAVRVDIDRFKEPT